MKDLKLFSCPKLNNNIKNVSDKRKVEDEPKVESHALQFSASISGNYC